MFCSPNKNPIDPTFAFLFAISLFVVDSGANVNVDVVVFTEDTGATAGSDGTAGGADGTAGATAGAGGADGTAGAAAATTAGAKLETFVVSETGRSGSWWERRGSTNSHGSTLLFYKCNSIRNNT